jgi:hypothetical protein
LGAIREREIAHTVILRAKCAQPVAAFSLVENTETSNCVMREPPLSPVSHSACIVL